MILMTKQHSWIKKHEEILVKASCFSLHELQYHYHHIIFTRIQYYIQRNFKVCIFYYFALWKMFEGSKLAHLIQKFLIFRSWKLNSEILIMRNRPRKTEPIT